MSPYSTLIIQASEAISRIIERLPVCTNAQLDMCIEAVQDWLDPVENTRAAKIQAITDKIQDTALDDVYSHHYVNKRMEILSDQMDWLFKEESLNNFIVKPDESP